MKITSLFNPIYWTLLSRLPMKNLFFTLYRRIRTTKSVNCQNVQLQVHFPCGLIALYLTPDSLWELWFMNYTTIHSTWYLTPLSKCHIQELSFPCHKFMRANLLRRFTIAQTMATCFILYFSIVHLQVDESFPINLI